MLWLEEPTLPDDFDGYARIRTEGGLAIAQGENLHTLHEFTHALTRGKGVCHYTITTSTYL